MPVANEQGCSIEQGSWVLGLPSQLPMAVEWSDFDVHHGPCVHPRAHPHRGSTNHAQNSTCVMAHRRNILTRHVDHSGQPPRTAVAYMYLIFSLRIIKLFNYS